MLRLDLLGPVELRRDGAALPLTVRKTLALLVLLARGGTLPRERVVALLWPQLDASLGRRNLRRELARLREAGVPDAVRAQGDLLSLADGVGSDVHAFEAALASGRPDEALAAWRGPPADGLQLDDAAAFDDWLTTERERLQALRRRALEASAAALEARGEFAAALQRVELLLTEDPLQEQRHRDAMRLLAACGRREAALAQYERCRNLLEVELGLTPMADTEALAAALRGAAPIRLVAAPPAPASSTASLLPERLPFVGRGAEVARLEQAWREGRTILIEGDANINKTRLATDFAAAHGPYALARCRPGDSEVPYAAITRALRNLVGPTPVLAGLPHWVVQELSRLLPEIGPAPAPVRSAQEQGRFAEACCQAWMALAGDSFDAMIIDDWHFADAASRRMLGFIAERRREAGSGGARELLVYRSELHADARRAERHLREGADALHLALQPLPADAVFELVRQLSGAGDPSRFAARLGQATAGNPFFLSETLRHLAEQKLLAADADGVWHTPFDDATQDYRELPMPASVRETVIARMGRLPATSRRVLEAAALADEPFAPALLAPACAMSELDTVLAIEQAVEARLLREHRAGGYAFAHDLVQQALDASLSRERRRLVHRRLALGAESVAAAPAVVAAHHEASGEPGRAVAHRLAAGDQAQRVHAIPEAMSHWQQALADGPTPAQAMALQLRLMRATRMRGERDASMAHSEVLHALAAGGALDAAERIEALLAVASNLARNGRAPEAITVLASLPTTLDDRQHALAMTVHVDALRESGAVDAAADAARAALDLPGLQGTDRADLLDALVLVEQRAGRPREALAHVEASVALCRQLGDEFGIVRGMYRRGTFLTLLGDLAGAEAEFRHGAAECARMGTVVNQCAMLYSLCGLHLEQGRAAQALALARQARALQPAAQPSLLLAMLRFAEVQALFSLGDWGQAWEEAAPAAEELLRLGRSQLVEAVAKSSLELLALIGESDLARRLLAAADEELPASGPEAAAEWWLARAGYELAAGEPAAAMRSLEAARATTAVDTHPRLQSQCVLLSAALAIDSGDAPVALAWLQMHDAPDDELQARALALRVAAESRCGGLRSATLAAARAALRDDKVHAFAALALERALAEARHLDSGAVTAARLADSLRAHPRQHSAFLHAWG